MTGIEFREQYATGRRNFRGINLSWADLRGADLRGVDFRWACLYWADLSAANLEGAAGLPDVPRVERLASKILGMIESGEGELEMEAWHTCGTTHCLAGWAEHLAKAYDLGGKLGTSVVGALIWHASCGVVPDFHASNEEALEWLREQRDREAAS